MEKPLKWDKFGGLLRKLRKEARLTQEEFISGLEDLIDDAEFYNTNDLTRLDADIARNARGNLPYNKTHFSGFEKGESQVNRRRVLLFIYFLKQEKVISLADSNDLLNLLNWYSLTQQETAIIFGSDTLSSTIPHPTGDALAVKHEEAAVVGYNLSPSIQPNQNNQQNLHHDGITPSEKQETPNGELDRHQYLTPPTTKMMALKPPSDFVERPVEFNQIVQALLGGSEKTVAITAAIRGASGFGKTTLAQAICHDARVLAAFPDGILWVTVGDDKANVLLGLRKLYQALTGKEAQFVDQHDATTQMSNILANRRCLIVIDDVWNEAHLQPFLEGGKSCVRLVTTRIADVVPKDAEVIFVDSMQIDEATALLGSGLIEADPNILADLARRLGEWPLLLKLVNRRLSSRSITGKSRSLVDALDQINAELNELGLTTFDLTNAEERNQAVRLSIGASLKWLQSDARYGHISVDEVARFGELAIFPKDTAIPIQTVALLWQQTGNLSPVASRRLCRQLADLALILRNDEEAETILLHDVMCDYLLGQSSPKQLISWHGALLAGYRAQCAGEWWQLPNDGYLYQHLFGHLQKAGQQEAIEELLLTYRWLDAKLQHTDVVSLIRDFDFRHDQQHHGQASLLRHALQMSVGVLAEDKDQLVSQLYGRLSGLGDAWQSFLSELVNQRRVTWLRQQAPSLLRPGGKLLHTLRGHRDRVTKLLLTPNGRLISACPIFSTNRDLSVKVWDIERGVLLHSLEGHTAGISNLLMTPDGRLVTSCGYDYLGDRDSSIKVWDINRGMLLHSLEGHTAGVSTLLLIPNGRLISSCFDGKDTNIKVWDIEQGRLLHSLDGHNAGVSTLLLTDDGRLLSSCRRESGGDLDTSIKVWDIERGQLLHSLEGHTDGVSKLLVTPDSRLISSCHSTRDTSIKVWDINRGMLHSLEEHSVRVSTLLLTPNGRLISSGKYSNNLNIRVWDIEQGRLLYSLEGHTVTVDNLLLIPDGRLISSCSYDSSDDRDSSVKVWDVEQGRLIYSLEGHNAGVSTLLLAPDGRLITACDSRNDHSVKVWDIEQGRLLYSLEGHSAEVSTLLLTPDGRLITACGSGNDHSVKVWDIEQGRLLYSLEGHSAGVSTLLLTPNDHLISSCGNGKDTSIKVWDVERGISMHPLEGHSAGVSTLLLTPNDHLISSCGDGKDTSIKVWDINRGMLHSLEEHSAGVSTLLLTPNGRLISSCSSQFDHALDGSIKVWDIEQGRLLHSLEGHTDGVDNLLVTPDGCLISSGKTGRDPIMRVWDIEQGRLLRSLEGYAGGVYNLLVTPDGRLISSGKTGQDSVVRVWDIKGGRLLHSLHHYSLGAVLKQLLTRDGRLIYSHGGGGDDIVRVWDIERGQLLHSLEGHKDRVNNLLLTPDGRLVSACGRGVSVRDHNVKVWDIERGQLLHSLEGHMDGVDNLLLTLDGRLISACGGISRSKDHSVKVWDIERGQLLHSLEEHMDGVSNLLLTPDGRLISACSRFGSKDQSVKVWDIERGVLLHSLEEHSESITKMLLLRSSGTLVATGGTQITVWNWVSGKKRAQYTTDGVILSCTATDDGTILVGDGLGYVHFLRLVEP